MAKEIALYAIRDNKNYAVYVDGKNITYKAVKKLPRLYP